MVFAITFKKTTSHCLLTIFLLGFLAHSSEAQNIAWLEKDMSCDQLTLEMKTRYSQMGNYGALSESKKQEIALVLDVICSARFEKCGFKNCKRPVTAVAQTPTVVEPTPMVDFTAMAREALNQKIAEHQTALQAKISEAVKRETSEKLGWVRVSMEMTTGGTEEDEEVEAVEEEVEEEPASNNKKSAGSIAQQFRASQTTQPKSEPAGRTRRPRMKSGIEPAVPASPTIDPSSIDGVPRGKFRSSSSKAFHDVRPPSILPNDPRSR